MHSCMGAACHWRERPSPGWLPDPSVPFNCSIAFMAQAQQCADSGRYAGMQVQLFCAETGGAPLLQQGLNLLIRLAQGGVCCTLHHCQLVQELPQYICATQAKSLS